MCVCVSHCDVLFSSLIPPVAGRGAESFVPGSRADLDARRSGKVSTGLATVRAGIIIEAWDKVVAQPTDGPRWLFAFAAGSKLFAWNVRPHDARYDWLVVVVVPRPARGS